MSAAISGRFVRLVLLGGVGLGRRLEGRVARRRVARRRRRPRDRLDVVLPVGGPARRGREAGDELGRFRRRGLGDGLERLGLGLRRRVGRRRPEGVVGRVRDVAEASGRILRRLSFRRRVAFVGRLQRRIWARAGRGGGGALARPLLRRALVLHLWYKPLCDWRVPSTSSGLYFQPVLILAYPREPPAHGGWLPRHLPRRPSQHDPNFFRPSVARAATKSRRNISSRRDMLYILAALLEEPKV